MAEFRIDQTTPGPGTPGVARHDLVPGEVLTLTATAPIGPGVSYSWEILDKIGSIAALSSPTGNVVTIGPDADITQPCAFRIRLTSNDNGTITTQTRIASVRTANAGLRIPLFAESAPSSGTLASNNPDASDDNASYPDRAGLGASAQNWRGWAEWAYELTVYAESLSGGGGPTGPAGGDLGGTYPDPEVTRIRGRAIHTAAPTDGQVYRWVGVNSRWEVATLTAPPTGAAGGDLAGTYPDPGVAQIRGRLVHTTAPTDGQVYSWVAANNRWEPTTPSAGGGGGGDTTLASNRVVTTLGTEVVVGGSIWGPQGAGPHTFYVTGYAVTAGTVTVRLYALNLAGPGPDDLRSTLTMLGTGNIQLQFVALIPVAVPSAPNEVYNDIDAYEVRVHISGGSPGDSVHVLGAGIR